MTPPRDKAFPLSFFSLFFNGELFHFDDIPPLFFRAFFRFFFFLAIGNSTHHLGASLVLVACCFPCARFFGRELHCRFARYNKQSEQARSKLPSSPRESQSRSHHQQQQAKQEETAFSNFEIAIVVVPLLGKRTEKRSVDRKDVSVSCC